MGPMIIWFKNGVKSNYGILGLLLRATYTGHYYFDK